MRPRFARLAMVLVLFAVLGGVWWAKTPTKLQTEPDELREEELLELAQEVAPRDHGAESKPIFDLPKLVELHGNYVSLLSHRSRKEKLWGWKTQKRLEETMRRALGKVDFPTLRTLTLGDGKSNRGNGWLHAALYRKLIAIEVARVCSEPDFKPNFPAEAPPLTKLLDLPYGKDAELVQRAMGPFAKVLDGVTEQKSHGLSANIEGFMELSEAFLRDPDTKVANDLLRVSWEDCGCGTGAPEFQNTKMTLVFIGLLRERRIAEALGASFFVSDAPGWMREPGRPFDQWRIDLLKFSGFDWEEVMLETGRLEFLAAAGSERGAKRALAELKSRWEKSELNFYDLGEATAFLIPGPPSDWRDTDPRKAISAETQAEILDLLNGAVRDEMGFGELDAIMEAFERLARPETKVTLQGLLKHPSTTFANRAASVLRIMGSNIHPILPAPPVRFRIFQNERPWRSVELAYVIVDSRIQYFGSRSVKTDREGFMAIPRDEFLDPDKRGTRIRFHQSPSGSGSQIWSEDQFDEPWVEAEVRIPTAFDETTVVKISAHPLPIEIKYLTHPSRSETVHPDHAADAVRMKLMKAGKLAPTDWSFRLDFNDRRVPPPEKFVLSTIAPGRYQFSVMAPASATYLSAPFEVTANMPPLRITLEKGCNVYASVLAPQNGRGAWDFRLFREGIDITKEFATESGHSDRPIFLGLPSGSYQIHVLSTTEFMSEHSIKEWPTPKEEGELDMREWVDCQGVSKDFTVDDTSPSSLDLGAIENRTVPEMQGKAGPARRVAGGTPPK